MGLGFAVELVGSHGQAREESTSLGAQGSVTHLRQLRAGAEDFTPVFTRIRRSFLNAERSRFDAGAQGGAGWAPDTARTLARKERRGQDLRTMRATGELARALTTGAGPGAVSQITAEEATFGTDLPRAVFAQRGSGRRRRRVIVITRRRREAWIRMVRDHLTGPA